MRSMLTLFALLVATPALAVPMSFTHQGHLVDAGGAPVEGAVSLEVRLFSADTGGDPLWTETHAVMAEGGHFSVQMGSITPLDSALFDGSSVWLELAVDGSALGGRLPLVSVPFAVRAGTADALAPGASIDVTSISIDGATVLDGNGLAGGLDADTLGDLSCGAGEVPLFDGAAWSCGSPSPDSVPTSALVGTIDIAQLPVGTSSGTIAAGDHTHGFGQITGQAAISQLPTGTSSDTVALGDHAHGFAQITGQAAIGQLPVGTAANTVAAGNHTHTAAQVGAVPMGNKSGSTCNAAGTIAWDSGSFYGCNGTNWLALAYANPDGRSSASAARSCRQILADYPSSANGNYWIDPDGPGSIAPTQRACDMAGGGFTSVYASDLANNANGWNPNTRTTCGSFGSILGGYNVFGNGSATQMTLDLAAWPHTEMKVAFNFVKIDSWDGESGILQVDSVQRWSKAYVHTSGTPECGVNNGPGSWAELSDPNSATFAHTANSAVVRFTSSLDQGAADESWGVQNIVIWVR